MNPVKNIQLGNPAVFPAGFIWISVDFLVRFLLQSMSHGKSSWEVHVTCNKIKKTATSGRGCSSHCVRPGYIINVVHHFVFSYLKYHKTDASNTIFMNKSQI